MLLSDRSIRFAIRTGELEIDPLDWSLIGPSSIDMRLGDEYAWMFDNTKTMRLGEDVEGLFRIDRISDEGLFLAPNDFILASTMETVKLGDQLAARLEGKSSVGRMGLAVHVTAGFIDPGFSGQITLELKNMGGSVICLRPGDLIGQLCLFSMTSPAERPYGSDGLGSRYQGQEGPTPARGLRER